MKVNFSYYSVEFKHHTNFNFYTHPPKADKGLAIPSKRSLPKPARKRYSCFILSLKKSALNDI